MVIITLDYAKILEKYNNALLKNISLFGRIKSALIIILYNLSIDDVEEIRKGMDT
ncbi:hypothetical protein U728_1609 [Clostridium botulinum 202F]|uniref:hypothetical protein n=1 Tax=unclassified Clostridium TaxID=2614128 RepID=UPI000540B5DA|nr:MULTISPECIES: hypothetical protein [unclassified Clostridium]AIY80575.1 hypothetical protein U728_1609 [Clostridium botulinum 202F]KAI3344949.1 hypothetical protein CIT17_15130 [Clostridium botulinum]MBY6779977.1 hypothetical protein [Clostridium botulinum]MBY6802475.1 hypothetical protein [Clostridium botulinum]MBY6812612.1 hypothetical protein [Clostridium botulinum]